VDKILKRWKNTLLRKQLNNGFNYVVKAVVTFSNNRLAIYADGGSIVETIEGLSFENNLATTSPEDLF